METLEWGAFTGCWCVLSKLDVLKPPRPLRQLDKLKFVQFPGSPGEAYLGEGRLSDRRLSERSDRERTPSFTTHSPYFWKYEPYQTRFEPEEKARFGANCCA